MSTIAFYEIEEWEKEHLSQSFPDTTVLYSPRKVQEETSADFYGADVLSTFIYSKLTPDLLSKFPNLKLIATRSTGYDHIDLAYCKEKNIAVVNVPVYGAHTVAEHTFALILAISRRLVPTLDRCRRGIFDINELAGFDLAGKTLGVIGAGKIGDKVVKLGQAFEMNVLVYTRHPEALEGQANVKAASLEELIANSDIVSMHLPLTPETKHLINKDNIKQFKKGSVLINTARGPLVETEAVLIGLEMGILRGAGLDVLEEEGALKEERELLTAEFLNKNDIRTELLNHVLITREDVLYTAHNGFNSTESVHQIVDTTIQNIQSFQQGTTQNSVIK